jgi:hypothetical protein
MTMVTDGQAYPERARAQTCNNNKNSKFQLTNLEVPKDFPVALADAAIANNDVNKDRVPILTLIPTMMPDPFGTTYPVEMVPMTTPKPSVKTTTRSSTSGSKQ